MEGTAIPKLFRNKLMQMLKYNFLIKPEPKASVVFVIQQHCCKCIQYTALHFKFGGDAWPLYGFRDIAPFQIWPNFPLGP